MRNPTLICICLHLISCPGHGEIGPHGAFLISLIFRGVKKQKIFIKGQITLLTHLVDDQNINVPLAIFMDLWQFPFFAGKTAQNGFSAFFNQLIKEDKKF